MKTTLLIGRFYTKNKRTLMHIAMSLYQIQSINGLYTENEDIQ